MRRAVSGLFVFAMLISTAAPPLAAQRTAVDLLLEKSRSLEGRGRLDLAEQTWRQVLLADPNNAEALAGLAKSTRQAGKLDESRQFLERLAKVSPNHPALTQVPAMTMRGQQNSQLQEADRLVRNQQYEQAMVIYERLYGTEPPAGSIAIAYYETQAATPGGWEKAAAGLQKLIDRYPGNQEYTLSLGKLQTYRPASRVAGMRLLESIRNNPPLEARARQAWRQALLWEGGSATSRASLQAYLTRYPDQELQRIAQESRAAAPEQRGAAAPGMAQSREEALGYEALRANNLPAAIANFEAALKTNPKSASALSGLGFVRMRQEDFTRALENFNAALAISPDNKTIRDAAGTAMFWSTVREGAQKLDAGQLDASVELFLKAVELRPNNVDAWRGLAGARLRQGQPIDAVNAYEKVVNLDAGNATYWRELVNAEYLANGSTAALTKIGRIPASAALKLKSDLEYTTLVATMQFDSAQLAESRETFRQAIELANKQSTPLSSAVQLQMAALYQKHGRPADATLLYRRVLQSEPENPVAWEGVLGSTVQRRDFASATEILRRMPSPVYRAAALKPAFLRAVATVQVENRDLSGAESILNRAREIERDRGINGFQTELQLGQLWLEQGKRDKAIRLLSSLAESNPEEVDVWKGLVAGLHREKRDAEAIAVAERVPQSVADKLNADVDYLVLKASVYKDLNRPEAAYEVIEAATSRYRAEGQLVPADLELQQAWLLLATPGSENELDRVLNSARRRRDLTPAQRTGFQDVWAAWTLRTADEAAKSGDLAQSITILETAVRALPQHIGVRRGLAGMVLRSGNPKRALALYKSTGMETASVSDYLGAIGAALGEQDKFNADLWMEEALKRWPRDPQVLNLAGKKAASEGQLKRAELYWRGALAQLGGAPRKNANKSAIAPLAPGEDPLEDLGRTLRSPSGGRALDPPATPGATPGTPPADRQAPLPAPRPAGSPFETPRSQVSDPAVPVERPEPSLAQSKTNLPPLPTPAPADTSQAPRPRSVNQEVDDQIDALAGVPAGIPSSRPARNNSRQDERALPALPPLDSVEPSADKPAIFSRGPVVADDRATPARAGALPDPRAAAEAPAGSDLLAETNFIDQQKTVRDEVADQIDAITGRNSPYFGTGGIITGRSGQQGFERMLIQQSELEASTTVGNQVRLSLVVRPVYIDVGSPDGTSEYRFGLLPVGATFETQNASGLGAEVQLSTRDFGLRAGASPRGFLVQNWIGGLRWRPANGPITILFDRDSVRDTLLSYAGVRDPISRQVFGGVIANSAQLQGNFGSEKSGFYFGTGFQYLQGENVADNRRFDGTVGAYFQVLKRPEGALTMGVNTFAMSYQKNLRYFSLGHGGYFSPQRFLLLGVPVRWVGQYQRLQYAVNGSIGSQSFTEESTPVFPTATGLQARLGPSYPEFSSTGANFNFDLRTSYQITPHWHIGGYANGNNTRNFTQQSVGLFLKYSFFPRAKGDLNVPSVPDWRGRQPFGLP